MANLDRLLAEVRRTSARKPIWLTEYGYQTNPPDRWLGVAPALQAAYVGEAALRAYQLSGRDAADPVPRPRRAELDALPERALHRCAGAEAGVLRVPPSARAGDAQRHARVLWGQIRPGKGARHVPDAGANARQRGAGRPNRQTNGARLLSRHVHGAGKARSCAIVVAARRRASAGRCSLIRVASNRPVVKGVILAGGTGTRLHPLTQITNKHLLPIYDRPMVSYAIEALVSRRRHRADVVTGGTHAGEFLRLLGNGHEFGIDLLSYGTRSGRAASRRPSGSPSGSSAATASA